MSGDAAGDIQTALSEGSNDDLLVMVGVVVAFCLSLYITGIMARRIWHRYVTRVNLVADRLVRKHLSGMYSTMISRIAAHKEWDALMEMSPSFQREAMATPCPTRRGSDVALAPLAWEMSMRWRIAQYVNFHDIQLLLPHEIDTIIMHCQKAVRKRLWFVRRQTINDTVTRSCALVYREYWNVIVTDYMQMLSWVRSVRG